MRGQKKTNMAGGEMKKHGGQRGTETVGGDEMKRYDNWKYE